MTQVEHSKGPWKILPEEVDKPYIRVRGDRLGGRFKIANVLTPVYADVHEREAQETRANAILIAAAPDLLEVLSELIPMFEEWHTDFPDHVGDKELHALMLARAAIAKAIGDAS